MVSRCLVCRLAFGAWQAAKHQRSALNYQVCSRITECHRCYFSGLQNTTKYIRICCCYDCHVGLCAWPFKLAFQNAPADRPSVRKNVRASALPEWMALRWFVWGNITWPTQARAVAFSPCFELKDLNRFMIQAPIDAWCILIHINAYSIWFSLFRLIPSCEMLQLPGTRCRISPIKTKNINDFL